MLGEGKKGPVPGTSLHLPIWSGGHYLLIATALGPDACKQRAPSSAWPGLEKLDSNTDRPLLKGKK